MATEANNTRWARFWLARHSLTITRLSSQEVAFLPLGARRPRPTHWLGRRNVPQPLFVGEKVQGSPAQNWAAELPGKRVR